MIQNIKNTLPQNIIHKQFANILVKKKKRYTIIFLFFFQIQIHFVSFSRYAK